MAQAEANNSAEPGKEKSSKEELWHKKAFVGEV